MRHLDRIHGEVPVALRMQESGGVVELLTSKSGGSWTIVLTTPDGTSCQVAAGNQSGKRPLPPTSRRNLRNLPQIVNLLPVTGQHLILRAQVMPRTSFGG